MKFEREGMFERGGMDEESLITKMSKTRFFDSLAINLHFSIPRKSYDTKNKLKP